VRGTAKIVESVVADLRVAVYEKLHRLTIRFFDKSMSGDIVNRVTNDTRQLLNLVGGELVNVTLQVGMGIVSLVILAVWNWQLAAVVGAFLPAYAMLFYRFLPLVRKSARLWRKSSDRLWGNWGEKLQGMEIIQAFTRERREAIRHHRHGHAAMDRWFRMALFGMQMNILGGFTSGMSRHTAWGLACLLVVQKSLNLGEAMGLGGLITYVLAPVEGVFSLINTWQQSAASSERIQKILGEVEEATRTEGTHRVSRFRGEVRFEHVWFTYEKNRPVLEDIHLKIEPGQNAALVGHTGSGKSTIVHLLQGFYRALRASGRSQIHAGPREPDDEQRERSHGELHP
jgi:ABC-type multidrug transport system fused ATPase/permease subunit